MVDNGAIRINCGGGDYLDAEANTWASDCLFTHGFHFFGGATQFSDGIENTTSDPLYQTERYFDRERKTLPGGYRIPLPDGRYRVKLHFAEIYESAVRSFSVSLEDHVILEDYDPSQAGFAVADVKSNEVVVDDGLLNIVFTASREAAKISAIEIERIEQ